MGINIELDAEKIVVVQLSGRVTWPQWLQAQIEVSDILKNTREISVLAIANRFEGWEPGTQWEDTSFQRAHDYNITRMAIVAEHVWEDLALMFAGQGLRPFQIEFFGPSSVKQARQWLLSDEARESEDMDA